MTITTPDPVKAIRPVSMNDTLPSGNPSLKTVLMVGGGVTLVALVLIFRSSLGF
jgi:hypothetical protein